MNEKSEKKAGIQAKKKIDKYSILGLLLGIGLLVAGILGIVTSRLSASDYQDSPDICWVDAVIEKIQSHYEKDKNNRVTMATYNTTVSFVVDGKTYEGKYEFYDFPKDYVGNIINDQPRSGDTIRIEVYKSQDGTYKVSPDNNPVNFLLYCAAIAVGLIVTAAMIYGILKPEAVQQNQGKKGKNRGKVQPGQKR